MGPSLLDRNKQKENKENKEKEKIRHVSNGKKNERRKVGGIFPT